VVRDDEEVGLALEFPAPYVVKPLWEGTSIGIGPDNLVKNPEDGERVVLRLLHSLKQPIMLETFVPGREVSWCFIENQRNRPLRSLAELIWENDPGHFDQHLYDAAHKMSAQIPAVRTITDELDPRDVVAMERLLRLVGPLGYGRIDGKLQNGRFVFLEVTPDAWLGTTGTFVSVLRATA
jgi:D-alanine-D-alanine ligase